MRAVKVVALLVLLPGFLFFSSCSSPSSGIPSSAAGDPRPASRRATEDTPLAIAKIQRAVDQALDWTKKGGGATILGVQELPQENAARADLRLDNFQFNADMYGTPVDKNKTTPPEPDIRDPNFYEKMYKNRAGQVHVERYSGQGVATLAHYSDGRWVLTGVQFGMNGTKANVEIR